MRLVCLIDNCVHRRSTVWGAHGLSFLIQTREGNILWDVGPHGELLEHNLRELGLEDLPVHAIALSHAHGDHTGALAWALERYPGVPIYANEGLWEPRYSRHGEEILSIGLSERARALLEQADLRLSHAPQEILPGVRTTGVIAPRPFPLGASSGHLVKREGQWVADPYHDDMALVLDAGDAVVLLCGCCHAGLRNTLSVVQGQDERPLRAVVGGTHLVAVSDAELGQIIDQFSLTQTLFYLNHCTGEHAIWALHHALGERVKPCPAGTVLTFGEA